MTEVYSESLWDNIGIHVIKLNYSNHESEIVCKTGTICQWWRKNSSIVGKNTHRVKWLNRKIEGFWQIRCNCFIFPRLKFNEVLTHFNWCEISVNEKIIEMTRCPTKISIQSYTVNNHKYNVDTVQLQACKTL